MKTKLMHAINHINKILDRLGNRVSISMLNYNLTKTETEKVLTAFRAKGYKCNPRPFMGYVEFEKAIAATTKKEQ